MNKKLLGIIVGIIIISILILGMQIYLTSDTKKPTETQPSTNIPQKPTNTGRNIVIELNESLAVTTR